jgi:hypothetical protein
LAATQVEKRRAVTDGIRADFPDATDGIDQLRAAFGPGVKAKYFSEGGKTMGKPIPFEGTDAEKIIRYDDMRQKRMAKGAK